MNLTITKAKDNYLIARDEEKIVGLLSCGKSKNDLFQKSGEIYSINIIEKYQGQGIGKKLFMKGIKELINKGYNNMIINVPQECKSINFFEKYSGIKIITTYDKKSVNNIIFFDNLNEIYNENKEKNLINKK